MGLVNKNLLTTDFRQTLLLVDDRPENLASLDAILDDGQRSLLKAESGEEALQLLLDHDVALVLLDVQMPLMNGYEVARLMRSNRKTRTIPIIFITAIEREEAAAIRGYQSGAIDYITKPVNALVLQSKVTLFLELDLARRKLQQAYVQVEHTKAYYESILNAAGEGVIGLNAKSQIDFMNPAAMSLLGTAEPAQYRRQPHSGLVARRHRACRLAGRGCAAGRQRRGVCHRRRADLCRCGRSCGQADRDEN
jgi:response regulator RpfG family c-di-GMP phosphodiesterase